MMPDTCSAFFRLPHRGADQFAARLGDRRPEQIMARLRDILHRRIQVTKIIHIHVQIRVIELALSQVSPAERAKRQSVAETYSWTNRFREIEQVVEQVLGGHGTHAPHAD